MHVVWGAVMIAIGAFFVVASRRKSQSIVYRMFVARARILWGDHTHGFLAFSGTAIAVVGLLLAVGVFS